LFAGEELVVFGRYRIEGRERTRPLVVAGRRNGRTERFTARVTFPLRATQNAYIPRLWAARKIAALSQALRLNGPNAELEDEIRDTALRYGLLSEYTSYLVREPLDVATRGVRDTAARGRRLGGALSSRAPSAAHGVVAVEAARLRQEQRRVKSSREADELEEKMLADRHDANVRHVAGRFFAEREGIWTDVTHTDSLTVIDVAAFSDAHFALLRSIPELAPYTSAFDRVLVAGKTISIRVGADGATRLTVRRMQQLVRAFRGR
jgi:Ca-activated chloride channel family protein